MSHPPELTDRRALLARRDRALRQGAELFLHEEVADEIEERLSEVNKSFTAPAIVTGFPQIWLNRLSGARIVADDPVLDLAEGAHDLVIHALALHWASDPVGQLVQARRALKPDGLFIAALFGGRTLHELRTILAEAESRLMGGLSPRVLPMGEIRDLGALLQRAGFALPVADTATKTVTYRTAFHLIADIRAMGESNALAARSRKPVPREFFPEVARLYAGHFRAADGRIAATFDICFLTGWAPHESQQKPLRPGSAVARLADALGSVERPAGPSHNGGND